MHLLIQQPQAIPANNQQLPLNQPNLVANQQNQMNQNIPNQQEYDFDRFLKEADDISSYSISER